jgi:chromosome segregation ATPase
LNGLRDIIRAILSEVNMGAADLNRRILELEEQVNNLSRDKRELEEKIKELTPRKMFTAGLNFSKPPYWVEA